MKSFLTALLQFCARLILRKYQPTIVGITGSVGKTSAKEAVYAALSVKFSVRASPKNYNNELGVPLTIVGARAPGRSLFLWCTAFGRALFLIIFPARYPAILILEMAADRPRDISKLVKLAPPKVGVITAVSPVHTEFFGSLKRVAQEKRRLVEAVPKDGAVVLNLDDEIVREFRDYTEGRMISYGLGEEAEFKAIEIREEVGEGNSGEIHFKILHQGSAVPVHLAGVLGLSHVYAALAATAVGTALGMNLVEVSQALLRYIPPSGRMRLIAGVKGTLIIDDTYNSSPRAAVAALETLGRLSLPQGARRYAVLADMLELGQYTESGHREAGRAAREYADVLIGVGVSASWIVDGAQKAGMAKDKTFHFHTLEEGVEHFLQERLAPGDVILIKGSQSMRMETLVKGLMAEPQRAKEFLCRQDQEWLV